MLNDPATSDVVIPIPVVPLAYQSTHANPVLSLLRTLGIIYLLLGTIHSAAVPLYFFIYANQLPSTVFALLTICTFIGSGALSIFEIIVGFGAIRIRPWTPRLMKIWAWLTICWLVVQFVVALAYQWHVYPQVMRGGARAYIVSFYLERIVSGLTVPILTLILLRAGALREVFSEEVR